MKSMKMMFEKRCVEVVGSNLASQMAHQEGCAPGKGNRKSKSIFKEGLFHNMHSLTIGLTMARLRKD